MSVQTNFEDAHAAVIDLVERFEKNHHHYLNSSYQEQEARKDFLDKFFMALGWDVNHETQTNPYEQEVKIEKSVITGTAKRKADYSFWFFIDSTVNFHSLQQNPVFQID